jgi:hypothetical protein
LIKSLSKNKNNFFAFDSSKYQNKNNNNKNKNKYFYLSYFLKEIIITKSFRFLLDSFNDKKT